MTKETQYAARWAPLEDVQDARAPRAWPRFMTARVAADYADTSPWTIRRYIVPCGRRGRCFIYPIEGVEAWMRGETLQRRTEIEPPLSKRRRPRVTSRARPRDLAKDDRRGPEVADDESNVAA